MTTPFLGMKRRLAFGVMFALWALKLLLGVIGALNGQSSNYPNAVRGFPYGADNEYYIALPAILALLNFLAIVFATRLSRAASLIFVIIQLLVVINIVFLGSGGV